MTDQTRLALEFICQSEDFKSGYNQVMDYFMGCAERNGEAFDNLEASGFFKVPESEELLSSIPSVHFKKEFVYDVLDLYQSKIGIHIFDSLDNNKDAWDENEYPVFYKVRKDYCDDFSDNRLIFEYTFVVPMGKPAFYAFICVNNHNN